MCPFSFLSLFFSFIIPDDEEVRVGFRLSKQEAASAFASDVVFIEKFIEEPRHIEIQLIADNHGNVVALPERECTIQRRNQKVIEESPSSFLDPKTRAAMQDQAASLAASVGYNSAGTVEFLVDKYKNFFFLEMNTRLQVEHPVTEAVTGLDLVELMIRSAAGERLPSHLLGARVPIKGWAFESRVYAEDPFRSFLPSTGRLSGYIEPQVFGERDPFLDASSTEPVPDPANPSGPPYAPPSIRADAGVGLGSEISMFYDPMICKLITHGATRDSALDRMRACLDAYVVRGVGNNMSFLRALCDHPRYASGAIDTGFIAAEYPEGFKGVVLTPERTSRLIAAAAIMSAFRVRDAGNVSGSSPSAELPDPSAVVVTIGAKVAAPDNEDGTPGAVTLPPSYFVRLSASDEDGELAADAEGDKLTAAEIAYHAVPLGDGVIYHALITPIDSASPDELRATGPTTRLRLGNVDWTVDSPLFLAGLLDTPENAPESERVLRLQHVARNAEGFTLTAYGATHDVYVRTPYSHALTKFTRPHRLLDASRALVSPMPGSLVSVAVEAGQIVEEGQEIAVVGMYKRFYLFLVYT
jgi:propionyl-CoA carboxylase alpha chain